MNQIEKKDSQKFASSSHNNDTTYVMPRIPITSKYQYIFFGHCYSCNNFGHKAMNCKAYEKFHVHKKNVSSNNPKERNHNSFAPLQRYDIECYNCNNYGHIDRECRLMTPTKKAIAREFQDKKQRKDWKKKK